MEADSFHETTILGSREVKSGSLFTCDLVGPWERLWILSICINCYLYYEISDKGKVTRHYKAKLYEWEIISLPTLKLVFSHFFTS